MQTPKFLSFSPEFKAQSRGVVLGIVAGWTICELANLPEGLFFVLTFISMGLLGLVFVAYDAAQANVGKPPVLPRVLFWRGLGEAGLGFVLMLAVEALRGAT